jgi:hypothetical protein
MTRASHNRQDEANAVREIIKLFYHVQTINRFEVAGSKGGEKRQENQKSDRAFQRVPERSEID